MIKMPKGLLPSMHEKNRYIAFEVISKSKITREKIIRAVWNSALDFLGESKAGKTGLWLMDWDEKSKIGILKTNHRSVNDVRASLALIDRIEQNPVICRVLGVSGTLKRIRARYMD